VPVALVTGTSTGIGHATALRLGRDGYVVHATVRTLESGADLAARAADEGLDVRLVVMDVADDASVRDAVAGVLATSGAVDVLVANAGVGSGSAVEETPIDVWREVLEINLLGAIRCAQAVLPGMRARGSGCLVAISSQAGRIALPSLGAYVASKWALEGVWETMAFEVARAGIRCVLVEPGAIITATLTKGRPPAVPVSAYAHSSGAFVSVILDDFGQGSQPDVVADAVAEAIATDDPRLRWPCGQGAARNLAARARLTDEQWIALGAPADDDELVAGFRRAMGLG
jgi:NAD(P)-dependent dehydrogenase (short-subunit alcohol dehydrogenase family)